MASFLPVRWKRTTDMSLNRLGTSGIGIGSRRIANAPCSFVGVIYRQSDCEVRALGGPIGVRSRRLILASQVSEDPSGVRLEAVRRGAVPISWPAADRVGMSPAHQARYAGSRRRETPQGFKRGQWKCPSVEKIK